jgi:hypothetical protein
MEREVGSCLGMLFSDCGDKMNRYGRECVCVRAAGELLLCFGADVANFKSKFGDGQEVDSLRENK